MFEFFGLIYFIKVTHDLDRRDLELTPQSSPRSRRLLLRLGDLSRGRATLARRRRTVALAGRGCVIRIGT